MKQNKHIVICKTDLRYDGRITSLINTLSESFTNDEILVYNLIDYSISPNFLNKNIKYYGFVSFLNVFKKNHLVQILKSIQFNLYVFLKLIQYNPKTIQLHHEPVLLGGLLYKLIFKKVILVYNDQEFFRYKEGNIPKSLYIIERKVMRISDLIIYTNEYRKRLSYRLYNNNFVKSIVIDNYVFDSSNYNLDEKLKIKIDTLKSNYKLLVHQGGLDDNRGKKDIIKLVSLLPSDWIITFLGIDDEIFNEFVEKLSDFDRKKVFNFGKISFEYLNSFWKYTADAALIIYNPTTTNNNYCAPNRLYAAVNVGVPILVNSNNYTLSNFVRQYKNGSYINTENEIKLFFENYDEFFTNSQKLEDKFKYNKVLVELNEYYLGIS